jgi:hypothetical protein
LIEPRPLPGFNDILLCWYPPKQLEYLPEQSNYTPEQLEAAIQRVKAKLGRLPGAAPCS